MILVFCCKIIKNLKEEGGREPFLLEYLLGLNFDSPPVQANPSDCKPIL